MARRRAAQRGGSPCHVCVGSFLRLRTESWEIRGSATDPCFVTAPITWQGWVVLAVQMGFCGLCLFVFMRYTDSNPVLGWSAATIAFVAYLALYAVMIWKAKRIAALRKDDPPLCTGYSTQGRGIGYCVPGIANGTPGAQAVYGFDAGQLINNEIEWVKNRVGTFSTGLYNMIYGSFCMDKGHC